MAQSEKIEFDMIKEAIEYVEGIESSYNTHILLRPYEFDAYLRSGLVKEYDGKFWCDGREVLKVNEV